MPRSVKKVVLLFWPMAGYQYHVLRGIRRYAGAVADWQWEGIAPDAAAPARLARQHPDGIIGMVGTAQLAAAVRRLRVPAVDASRWLAQPPGAQVAVDDRQVGELAATYFLQRGFKHFAFVGSVVEWFAQERQRGFISALREAGCACPHMRVEDPEETLRKSAVWSRVNPALGRWLTQWPQPLAVFASADPVGLMVLATCRYYGLAVPQEVAVLGVDDDELMSTLANPPLSSVQYPAERIGYEAAQLLHGLLARRPAPAAPLLLPPLGIITRASTDRLAVADPDVLKAARLIQAGVEAGDTIRIAPLAYKLAVSRRSLEMKFKKTLGHSIQDEIRRAHLEVARKLLADTDLKTLTVAARSGFANASRLCLMFKQHLGVTPSAYRQRFRVGGQ